MVRLWLVTPPPMSTDETPPPDDLKGPARPGVLSLVIKDRNALYMAYMPFLKGGGLFIPSHTSHQLGDEVFLLLTFPDTPEKVPVAGHVVWVTPQDAAGGRMPGIGIQFSAKDADRARATIEAHLGSSPSDRPTHTM